MGWSARTFAVAAMVSASAARGDVGPRELGWPDGTAVARTRHHTRVFDGVGVRRIGTIAANARLAVQRIVKTADTCRAWIELAPRGWVCAADVAPTDGSADVTTTPPTGAEYAGINRGTMIYADVQSIEDGAPTRSAFGHTMVALRDATVKVYNKLYVATDQGWIARNDLAWYAPSEHEGVSVPTGAALDAAWAVPRGYRTKIAVRDAPSPTARVVREVARRELVTVSERDHKFARVGDGEWIADADVRRAAAQQRPDGVAAGEKWIDIDLDQQVLVAYEGDAPVFATVVSTGLASATPTGIYRIRGKDVRTRMQNPAEVPTEYGWNVADVPYAMRFRKNFALHGAYWHDGFGRTRSQGCVNLSPKDAHRLFEWVTPDAPPGWLSVDGDGGTPVRIRNARDPSPRWLDYEGKPVRVVAKAP